MNAIVTMETPSDHLGWWPNVDRLRRDYEAARHLGRPDPRAVVEAECWLDLIEAELTATSTRADPDLRARLVGWRLEVAGLLVRLRALAVAPDKTSGNSFSHASVSQRVGASRDAERPGNLAMPQMSPRHGLSPQPNHLEEAS